MTHDEFNHIVQSLSALSPEQMRQLRRELDGKIAAAATKPPAADADPLLGSMSDHAELMDQIVEDAMRNRAHMSTETGLSTISEAAILSRLIRPEADTLTPEAAEGFLKIKFAQSELDRMHELAVKNQDGLLTPREQEEMENYRRVGFLLDLMHSKARRALKKQRAVH
jgi:hypothetical protein